MKILKKILLGLGILIVLLLGAGIILPIVFRDEIVQVVKDQANENLNAKVDFGEVDLSLISTFPDFGFTIEDIKVDNVGEFEGLTLAEIKEFDVRIDLMSVINGEKYEIKRFALIQPDIHVKVLEDGTANWDIMKASTDTAAPEEPEEAEPDTGAPMQIGLQEYTIEKANVIYDDASLDMYSQLKGFTHSGTGDFTMSNFTLGTQTDIDTMDFVFGGVNYLTKANLALDADLGMDMENLKFTFKENELRLNELLLAFDGWFSMPEEGFDMDLTYSTQKTDIRYLLSLVPALYTEGFEDIQTSGKLGLAGYAKGMYSDNSMPGFGLDLTVEDGSFQYPDLPESADNINIDLKVQRKEGPDLDNMLINMSEFHVELAENPIDMQLLLSTPMSDPNLDANIQSQIDLASLKDVVPVEGAEYNGNVTADVELKGRMSAIENEQYEKFTAKGKFILLDMLYQSEDLGYDVAISKTYFNFSPQYLELSSFESTIGKSDLKASGKIDNYLAYYLKDETLKGRFDVNSNRFDLNELMGSEEEGEAQEQEEATSAEEESASTSEEEMAVIEVPGNIDFQMQASFGKLLYDDIDMNNVRGGLDVKDQAVHLRNLYLELLGGNVTVNGVYSTKNPKEPDVDFTYIIEGLDIQRTATKFNTVDKLAPIAKNTYGDFSSRMNFNTSLDQQMEPITESIEGNGTLSSKQVKIKGFKVLTKLGDALKMDEVKEPTLKDINLSYEFKDGKVYVDPFDIKYDDMTATISGNTSFDQKIDYKVDMTIPREKFGSQANQALESLIDRANKETGTNFSAGETVDVTAKIGGTIQNPKIVTDLTGTEKSTKETVKEKVEEEVEKAKEKAEEEVRKKAKELIEEARKEGDKLVMEAEKKAARIKREARKESDKIIERGEKEADRLVEQANNPIAKAAAKEAAKKAKKEAQKEADKVLEDADKRADRIVDEAKKEKQQMIEEAKKEAEKDQ